MDGWTVGSVTDGRLVRSHLRLACELPPLQRCQDVIVPHRTTDHLGVLIGNDLLLPISWLPTNGNYTIQSNQIQFLVATLYLWYTLRPNERSMLTNNFVSFHCCHCFFCFVLLLFLTLLLSVKINLYQCSNLIYLSNCGRHTDTLERLNSTEWLRMCIRYLLTPRTFVMSSLNWFRANVKREQNWTLVDRFLW